MFFFIVLAPGLISAKLEQCITMQGIPDQSHCQLKLSGIVEGDMSYSPLGLILKLLISPYYHIKNICTPHIQLSKHGE